MKNKIYLILTTFALTVLSACGNKTTNYSNQATNNSDANETKKSLTGITFESKTFTYDGQEHSLAISGELPEGIIVTYEGNNKVNAGSYYVTAKFSGLNDEYYVPGNLYAALTIEKADYDMSGISFPNRTFEAQEYSASKVKIVGDLPEEINVTYSNDDFYSNDFLGEHVFTATFHTSNPNYNDPEPLTNKVTITKGHIDTSEYSFEDQTISYDGKPHTIRFSWDEETYEGRGVEDIVYSEPHTDVGIYTCTGTIVNTDDYYPVDTFTATLTIVKAEIDFLSFEDATYIKDGKSHSLTVKGEIPEGINVEYTNNEKTEAGIYEVTAHFTGSNKNYIVPNDMKATMTITDELTIENNKVNIGEYPQSRVKDEATIAELEKLDISEDGYYHYSDNKYVKQEALSSGNFGIGEDNFEKGDVFYFLVEPITWNINSSNDNYFISTEQVIDQVIYSENRSVGYIGSKNYCSANYEISNARAFLNGYEFIPEAYCKSYKDKGFIDLYFNDIEKSLFKEAHLTHSDNHKYNDYDVTDKIFLPSVDELKSSSLGFPDAASRVATMTDFAKVKGNDHGFYLTRTPSGANSGLAFISAIQYSNGALYGVNYNVNQGLRPFAII
mgnify:CR=1 FL=1